MSDDVTTIRFLNGHTQHLLLDEDEAQRLHTNFEMQDEAAHGRASRTDHPRVFRTVATPFGGRKPVDTTEYSFDLHHVMTIDTRRAL